MQLDGGFTLQWAALDPTSGAPVSGVVISAASMLVQQITPSDPSALQTDVFKLAPLFVPLPIDVASGG